MKTTQSQNQLMQIAAIVMIAAAEARAQETTRKIVVSIPDRKLVLLEGERTLKVYDVAVGKTTTPSPSGEFQIINHVANPTWFGPEKTVAPGPGNPIGTRWMGLSKKGYGIHGTNVPTSIGKAASHGCIRMRNKDVEELFTLVGVGVTVELHAERPEILNQILSAE
jgi:L,D-transpeptidase ErfK/SrfK